MDAFDPIAYANRYPDLYATFGYNSQRLRQHYQAFGIREGRDCTANVESYYDPSDFWSAQQASAAIGVPRRLALMATHTEAEDVPDSILQYVRVLARLPFDRILVLTTNSAHVRPDTWPAHVTLHIVPNLGLDFGQWFRVLKHYDTSSLECLVLANDSCTMESDLTPVWYRMQAQAAAEPKKGFWSITDSIEHEPHLQSYFLVFNKQAIAHLKMFIHGCLPTRNCCRNAIIVRRELALSRYMQQRGFELTAAYDRALIEKTLKVALDQPNVSWAYPHTMRAMGCPLIKKSVSPQTLQPRSTLKSLTSLTSLTCWLLNQTYARL